MKRTANALRRVGAVLASTLNIGLFDATEYGELCENCCEKEKGRRVRDSLNNRGRVVLEVIGENGVENGMSGCRKGSWRSLVGNGVSSMKWGCVNRQSSFCASTNQ